MAQIIFNIPDAVLQRVIDGVAYGNGYQDFFIDLDGNQTQNPVSKANYARQAIRTYIKDTVRAYEAQQAALLARQAAEDAVDDEVSIT